MNVLIAGAGGQFGRSLLRVIPVGHQVHALTRAELDITDAQAVEAIVHELGPDAIVNAAAYTAVDQAEADRELTFAINAGGAENLARAAQACGARLIHVSTDFVFDGKKSSPYLPADTRNPLGVYGASKAEGEDRVQAILGDSAVIVRTGWVYAAEGHNFVNTILGLLRERDSLKVIADQVGTPTWAVSLAETTWKILMLPSVHGVHHWSDAGVASWYDFAVAIQEEAMAAGILSRTIPVYPIATEEYPLPAKRPAYSVLDKRSLTRLAGIIPAHWRTNLRKMLVDIRK